MKGLVPAGFLALSAAACSGDAAVRHVVFTTGTTLGVDIEALSAAEDGVRVGYHRLDFVSMPTRRAGAEQELLDDALPVLSVFALDTGNLLSTRVSELHVLQVFSTGLAASGDNAAAAVAGAASGLVLEELLGQELSDLEAEALDLFDRAWKHNREAAERAVSDTLAGGDWPLVPQTLREVEARLAEASGKPADDVDDADYKQLTKDQVHREVAREMIEAVARQGDRAALRAVIDELKRLTEG